MNIFKTSLTSDATIGSKMEELHSSRSESAQHEINWPESVCLSYFLHCYGKEKLSDEISIIVQGNQSTMA